MSDTNEDVTIKHTDTGSGGKYIAEVPGEKTTGYLEWEAPREAQGSAEVRIATHTVVPPAIGGRGIAGLLVERLIADAREHGFRIVPQCSYVERKFAANPDWSDLRA